MNVAFQILDTGSYIVGNTVGFVAKQIFCVSSLEPVRRQLEQTISRIASPIFGSFLGGILGNQLSYASAIPMTSFLGNLVWSWIADVPQVCVSILISVCFPRNNNKGIAQWMYTAVRVSGTVLGHLANSYFCLNAMPIVKQVLEGVLKNVTPLVTSWQITPILPLVALCVTPTITFSAGDLLGIIIKRLTIISGHFLINRFDYETNLEAIPIG